MGIAAHRLLLLTLLASVPHAALRVRYSYCTNHDSSISTTCSERWRAHIWHEKMLPGIWDGFDTESGFDGIGVDDHGSFGNAPNVSAAYWIDSVYEGNGPDRKNGPLVEGFAGENDLLDPTYELRHDGYVLFAAGGLKIDQPGSYELQWNANDALFIWVDLNRDGTIEMGDHSECINGTRTDWGWDGRNEGAETVDFGEAGVYKILLLYWDWGEVGHAMLSWRKPGGAVEPIPPSAFGKRKNFGRPIAQIESIEVNGILRDQTSWGNLDVNECDAVRFTAKAVNMLEQTPTFEWDFYGNGAVTLETAEPVVVYQYAHDPSVFLIQPSVRVKRGAILSAPSSNTDVVFIWLTDDPNTDKCSTAIGKPVRNSHVTVADGETLQLFDLFGRAIRRSLHRGRGAPHLAPGVYLLRGEVGTISSTGRSVLVAGAIAR